VPATVAVAADWAAMGFDVGAALVTPSKENLATLEKDSIVFVIGFGVGKLAASLGEAGEKICEEAAEIIADQISSVIIAGLFPGAPVESQPQTSSGVVWRGSLCASVPDMCDGTESINQYFKNEANNAWLQKDKEGQRTARDTKYLDEQRDLRREGVVKKCEGDDC